MSDIQNIHSTILDEIIGLDELRDDEIKNLFNSESGEAFNALLIKSYQRVDGGMIERLCEIVRRSRLEAAR